MKKINKIKKSLLAGMATGIASVLLSTGAFAQTTFNVGTGQTYTTIAAAITYVNNTGNSIAGGITFNIISGHTETPPVGGFVITRQGTATDYIIFQKASGAATTPLITAYQGTGTTDAVFVLNGADYVTIDGIDIQERTNNNTATPSGRAAKKMEYGYLIKNSSGINGATNNTIKNSVITLFNDVTNTNGATGILQTTTTTGGGVTPTNVSGANSNNTYQNITIQTSLSGFDLLGTTGFPDLSTKVINSIIGSTIADNISFNGNTYGIRLSFQSGAVVEKNIIRNITSTSTTGTAAGIDFVNGAGSNLINNNVIYNVKSANTTAATIAAKGISINGNAGSFNIDYNTVNLSPSNTATSNANLEFTATTSVNSIRNNIFANFTAAQSGSAKHYAIILPTNAIGGGGSESNNNDLFINNTTNGFVGKSNGTDRALLADWRTNVTGADTRSISIEPVFTGSDDLRPSTASKNNWYLNGTGVQIATISNDIANSTVPAAVTDGAPDLGAYQFSPASTPDPLTVTGTIGVGNTTTYKFGDRTIATIEWVSGTNLPTNVDVFYYPGTNLDPYSTSYEYFNSYWHFSPTGGTNFTYNVTINFMASEKGNISGNTLLAKTVGASLSQWIIPVSQSVGADYMTANGLTEFSRFTGTGDLAPLPVNLVDFNVIRKNEVSVTLNWKTLGEINNDRFEIERSKDGINFITVGTVTGNGTTSDARYYQFEDQITSVANPVLYYRLKQVDYNGTSEYSDIKKLVSTVSIADLKAWYNQAEEKIQVSSISNVAGAVNINVIDIQGRVVAQQNTQFTKGSNAVNLSLQNLPKGIYTLYINSEEGIINVNKILKY